MATDSISMVAKNTKIASTHIVGYINLSTHAATYLYSYSALDSHKLSHRGSTIHPIANRAQKKIASALPKKIRENSAVDAQIEKTNLIPLNQTRRELVLCFYLGFLALHIP